MGEIYVTIDKIVQKLQQRSYQVDEVTVKRGMVKSGLRLPLDNEDLLDLIKALRLKRTDRYLEDKYLEITRKKLESNEWRDSVLASRHVIGIPAEGITLEQARELFHASLRQATGTWQEVTIGGITKPVLRVWTDVVGEARKLCRILKVNPDDADNLFASLSAGHLNVPLGVGKILFTEVAVTTVNGQEIIHFPNQCDRIIGHLLWGLALSPSEVVGLPTVSLRWERLPDGSGRMIETRFSPGQNTATEDKALRRIFAQIKETVLFQALVQLELDTELRNKIWRERWRIWMKVYPDLPYPSPGALRKAVARAMEKYKKRPKVVIFPGTQEKDRIVTLPKDETIAKMNSTQAATLMRMFNARVDRLEEHNLLKNLSEGGITVSGKQGETIKIQRTGPDNESVKAGVLALRFFVPNYGTHWFRAMASIYGKVPASQDLVDKLIDACDKTYAALNNISPFKFNDEEFSYRQICEVFLWGSLPQANLKKKEIYDAWVRNPFLFSFLQNEFVYSLNILLNIIFFIRRLNREALNRLQNQKSLTETNQYNRSLQ